MEYHHFLVEGGWVVDRNGLGLPNRVLGEFDHIHLEIDSIYSIVRSHEASVLVGPDISPTSYRAKSGRVAPRAEEMGRTGLEVIRLPLAIGGVT